MPHYIMPTEYDPTDLLDKLFITCESAFCGHESFLQEEKTITANRVLFIIIMNSLFDSLKQAVEPELFKSVLGGQYQMEAILEALQALTDGWLRLKQPKYNYADMMVGMSVGNAEFLVSELLKKKQ